MEPELEQGQSGDWKEQPARFTHSIQCKVAAEFVGTYYLVFVVGCNVLTSSIGSALSIGAILMVMVYALLSVSGAHFNPAVTLAVWASRRGRPHLTLTNRDALLYVLAHFLASISAAFSYWVLFRRAFEIAPAGQYGLTSIIVVEVLYTMALCYVFLNVTTTQKQDGSNYFGIAIGFTVVAASLSSGGISGCVLNPAVAVGCTMVVALESGLTAFRYLAVYAGVPFLGSILAAAAFFIVQKRDEYDSSSSQPYS